MAEKQLAYREGGKDEFFADDDPLAELARIVGFDQRPATPVAANQRQEPAFDLEDELLREFERYDAPRVTAAQPAEAPVAVYPEPVNANALPVTPVAAAEQYSPPLEPATYHDRPQDEIYTAPAEHAGIQQDDVSHWDPAEESWDSVIEPTTMPIDATPIEAEVVPEAPIAAAPSSGARDLIDELEMSIAGAPAVEPAGPKTQQWAAATIRLPLANFNAARREPPAVTMPAPEPMFETPAPIADAVPLATFAYPAELDRHDVAPVEAPPVFDLHHPGFDLVAAARDGTVQADAALTEPAYAPTAGQPRFDIDDLLADVSRYPVPAREQSARFDAFSPPQAPALLSATPVAAEPMIVPTPGPRSLEEVEVEEPVSFDDHDFDLDLADIELELAELDFADTKTAAPVEAPSAPSKSAPIEDWLEPAPALPVVSAAPAAPVYAPVVAAAPARPAQQVAASSPEPVFDLDQQLPFDPSEISDTEDRVESFEDMHVPALPPSEPDEPVAAAPDYDFDIDAEMASLFSAPADMSPEPAKSGAMAETAFGLAAAAPVRGLTMQQKPSEGLDEFERALEEDFRRSFRETAERPEVGSSMMFESSHAANDRWRARSMRGVAIAAAAVVLIGGSAFGAYRWMSHNGSPLSFASGEPRVITADKDPVKVVPTDPGGKIVPNQDKAVYDRVAGAATQPPKQKELVTSDEQPVDVVQKTLIPENSLPDDSDGNADGDSADANASTPVGETEDPRLLPGQVNAAANNGQDSGAAVSPRRVRTMIVKPDGSLVAREEAPPSDEAGNAPTPAVAGSLQAPAGNTQVAAGDDSDAPNADSAPIRMVKTTQLANAPAAPLAAALAPAPTAATPAPAPTAASDAAPVPTARPTQTAMATPAATQPSVNVAAAVAKPPVAPKPPVAKPTVAPKPVQVAAASPQPAKQTAAAAAAAGGYVMQIASLPSEEEAKRSQANLSAKFGNVLAGHPIEVRKFDIAGKGTYYRVRVAVGSKDDAAALCVKFRAAGGTCLISK
jgi:hypothetical protein